MFGLPIPSIGSVFGLKGMAIAGAIAFAAGTIGGYAAKDVLCDAAAAKVALRAERAKTAELERQKAYLLRQVATHAANVDDANQRSETLERHAAEAEQKVKEYEDELAKRPATAACVATDDDLRGWDRLRPQPRQLPKR